MKNHKTFIKQEVIFSITVDKNDEVILNIAFRPGRCGEVEHAMLTEKEKYMQNMAGDIASKILDLIRQQQTERPM